MAFAHTCRMSCKDLALTWISIPAAKTFKTSSGTSAPSRVTDTQGTVWSQESATSGMIRRCRPRSKSVPLPSLKKYNQSFKLGEVAPEFYLTVSNTLAFNTFHTRKPKSFIGVEYVKCEVPVLQPAVIIAEKVRIIPHRKTKDLYKDIFDIYALFNLSGTEIRDSQIVTMLAATGLKVSRYQLLSRFKETSDPSNARNAIKLPTHSRTSYLKDWCGINSFVRDKVLDFSRAAGMLDA